MLIQLKNIQSSKVEAEKAASSLRSHLKYLQHGGHHRDHESENKRHFFNDRLHNVDRLQIQQEMMRDRVGESYYHTVLLAPDSNEPVHDWRHWTCALMHDLETRFGQELHWYAIHHQKPDSPHVHVIVRGTAKDRETGHATPVLFTRQDFQFLRESGRAHSEYEHQHFLTEKLRELDERDTLGKNIV